MLTRLPNNIIAEYKALVESHGADDSEQSLLLLQHTSIGVTVVASGVDELFQP